MAKKSTPANIRLRGVRHNNLKNFDLDLPQNRLIVITGLSGSGKSSLAFDTLFAEGQRRYIETFSPYARQFFDRMDKPQVDSIEGIPPAIAIEQRNSVRTTRSTVGTMTEICDYMKVLWPQIAQLHCRQCGRLVRKDSPREVWQALSTVPNPEDALITFEVPISEKLSLEESLALIAKQGYQRLLLNGEALRLEEATPRLEGKAPKVLTIIQDRLKPTPQNRSRFVEACEQAYHFGKGRLAIHRAAGGEARLFSNRVHCATCDLEYRDPSPALFSFNHPLGACPACKGFGRIISIDYQLALPDTTKTLAGGAVRPWQTGQSAECQTDMMKFCRLRKVPTDVPYRDLPKSLQDWVLNGDPDYGKDAEHEFPRAWYGIKGYFRWLESKSYKMHVRVLLSRYRTYTPCPTCHGKRFQPESLLYRFDFMSPTDSEAPAVSLTLSDFYQLSIRDALKLVEGLASAKKLKASDPLGLAISEVQSRLAFLNEVGLGYLTLDRPTRSLSGGETERVNLTTCLGSRLVNTLFVLDEPSVGLHARDTDRLVRILQRLRDAGNTVVVVEHEASVMRAADRIIDLGPGHGSEGGSIVFEGSHAEILRSKVSLTGQYLSGSRRIDAPKRRPVRLVSLAEAKPGTATPITPAITLSHATQHNLRDLTVQIPLGRLVCLTGVSGSGKTTLARDILLPLLNAKLSRSESGAAKPGEAGEAADDSDSDNDSDSETGSSAAAFSASIAGWETLGRIVLVDQTSLGKTPRSNPAVYIGAFEDLREVFAQSELARQRGLNASAFSFNSAQGQCERCRGAGFEKIEMQFLSDIFIRCPDCNGRRYRSHILEIKLSPGGMPTAQPTPKAAVGKKKKPVSSEPETSDNGLSIADLLESSVDDAIIFLGGFSDSRPAKRAVESLKLLQEVGLGYLHLGQPINTLSGGESQRLKLVKHLTEFAQNGDADPKPALFVFDEPTTGLHFDDVRVLLKVFQRLVDAGQSVLIIEHNLDVIRAADWVIDLGPEAGDQGGRLVGQGTPEELMNCPESRTGEALGA